MNSENIKEMDPKEALNAVEEITYDIESIATILEADNCGGEEQHTIEEWWRATNNNCHVISGVARTIRRLIKHQRELLQHI